MNKISSRLITCFLLLFFGFLPAGKLHAQCYNWKLSAQTTLASNCAASGAVSTNLVGPDAANLSNVLYGIPTAANGFSVALNPSPNFSGLPPGTYLVSAVGLCGGNWVGRTTTVTVPGSYEFPTSWVGMNRSTWSCVNTGIVSLNVKGGSLPITYTMLSHPPSYTGPLSKTLRQRSCTFDRLPRGRYIFQTVDSCLSGTTPDTANVDTLVLNTAPLDVGGLEAKSCDSIILNYPSFNIPSSTVWDLYSSDTTFSCIGQVIGVMTAPSPAAGLFYRTNPIKLPAGKSVKDCYLKTIAFTLTPRCGPDIQLYGTILPPQINWGIKQHCNIDFSVDLSMSQTACYPQTFTLVNSATNISYGPFTASSHTITANNLPFGHYTVTATTGDGYVTTDTFSVNTVASNPYSVSANDGSQGFNNYISGFTFTTLAPQVGGNRQVELFSGPAGYTFKGTSNLPWNSYTYSISFNGSPTASTLLFPPGTYVWKITDTCGVYYLPITVPNKALYQYTVGVPTMQQTCNGLLITPTGTATNAGLSVPMGFSLFLDGAEYLDTFNYWHVYPAGTSILLRQPGVYTIVPTAAAQTIDIAGYYRSGNFSITYPNIYTSSYTFTYTHHAVEIDVNKTQGYLCKGAAAGQAQIIVTGKNGTPFTTPPPRYYYWLALPGNAISGPFIAGNTTGIFTNFGGNAGNYYDVKVGDACGAIATQRLRILDLGTARVIAASTYVACTGDSVQLSTVYLPDATYSWTGPNGYSSTQQRPVIYNLGPANVGVYRLTVTTSACNSSLSDSTVVTVAGSPPKPTISYQCQPKPITLSITNPATGLFYQWQYGYPIPGAGGISYRFGYYEDSDTLLRKYVYDGGSYRAIAIDTITGCSTRSDSLNFSGGGTMTAGLYTPHPAICTGDTATLVATGFGTATPARFQWLRNGLVIAGATAPVFITALPGNYRVFIDAGLCNADTSDTLSIRVIPPPVASITTSSLRICSGDTATLKTPADTSYQYSWTLNGATIPWAFSDSLKATLAGTYTVTVANSGCAATATPVVLNVSPAPVVLLSPSGPQQICTGDSLLLSTPAQSGAAYHWLRNGATIPGVNGNTFSATQAGHYEVVISTTECPNVHSPQADLTMLPGLVALGPDTTDCGPAGSFKMLLDAGTGFSKILWNTGENSRSITATGPGVYWVVAMNQCGTFRDTMRVHSPDEFAPNLPVDTVLCNAWSAAWLRVPALLKKIRWSTGETTPNIYVTAPGIYWVEGQSPCGLLRDTTNIRICAPKISELNLSDDNICAGDCVDMSARATGFPEKYHWRFAGGNPTESKLNLSDDNICAGDCVDMSARATGFPEKYHWRFAGGNPTESNVPSPGFVCYDSAGVFPVWLFVESKGGRDSASRNIVVTARPVLRFKDTTIIIPYKARLSMPACAEAQRADWYLGDSLVCAGCRELQLEARYFYSVYRCVLRNGDCPDSCSYALRVVDIPNELWLPDAFTPNGDGRNDLFHIITDNPNVQVIGLSIYNRWGQQVFQSNMNNGGWDGTLHGQAAESGTYFWQLRYKVWGRKDEVFFKKGEVLLVR